jgi:hypothetical protein
LASFPLEFEGDIAAMTFAVEEHTDLRRKRAARRRKINRPVGQGEATAQVDEKPEYQAVRDK